ncbi:MAG: tetratricopeptide repeat protein, partial [Gemmatimonadaceae bacterium]
LVARYPDWPEAQTAAAEAANMEGAWLAAADHLRRAIASEPVPDTASGARCRACETRLLLVATYKAADSLAAALRVAQALVRAQPHSRVAWLELSHALGESGRYDDARAALDSSTRYATGTDDDVIEHAQIEIRARNFATADRLLTTLAQTGNANSGSDALWYLVISLRTQGRLREALGVAQGSLRHTELLSTVGTGTSRAAEAQVLFELGQYRRAAALFTALAWPPDSFAWTAEGRIARQRVWMLTQAGSALAAAGDTAAVAALADTIQQWGRKSGFGRDRRLHDYLTGLLWMARARPDSALAAYQRATLSESEGFSRLQLERGRALLALGRPREAIPILRQPLAGTLEAGNFYASRTAIEEMLARAYDAAGQRDSAAVYYRYVVNAWRGGDAQFESRVARAREGLAVDEHRLIAKR